MQQCTEYQRPMTLAAALALLSRAAPVTQPLAGGTHFTRAALPCEAVVDLRDLGLGDVRRTDTTWQVGAMVTLGDLAQVFGLPAALSRAAQREWPRNIRQRATLGGSVASGDSGPLLACLLALDGQVHIEPGARVVGLADYLAGRLEGRWDKTLIVAISFDAKRRAALVEVARTPADAPLLCAAVGAAAVNPALSQVSVAVGAAGQPLSACPQIADLLEGSRVEQITAQGVARVADIIAWQDDVRASADYRQAMVLRLICRACAELQAASGESYHEG